MLRDLLRQEGTSVGRRHVATLMKRMGLEALYRRPNTSKPAPGHKIYPYLLRKLAVTRPNQVWATDITYVPMACGFVYLVAIVDWFTRRVLTWRLSISLDAGFCIEALEEALARHGRPAIFNSDQGSQFTSTAFTAVLLREKIAISMDGKGCWRDNVFVERLWRSVKYEEVYLNAYASVPEARAGIGRYIRFYNAVRPHSGLGGPHARPDIFRPAASRSGMINQRRSTYSNRELVQTSRATSKYGKWNTIYRRFRRWSEAGTWEIVSVTLAEMMADTAHYRIDITTIRAHVSAAGVKGGFIDRLLAARGAGSAVRFTASLMPAVEHSPSI